MIPQFVRMPLELIESLRVKKKEHNLDSMAETVRQYLYLGIRTEDEKKKIIERKGYLEELLEMKDKEKLVDAIFSKLQPTQIEALAEACKLARDLS